MSHSSCLTSGTVSTVLWKTLADLPFSKSTNNILKIYNMQSSPDRQNFASRQFLMLAKISRYTVVP